MRFLYSFHFNSFVNQWGRFERLDRMMLDFHLQEYIEKFAYRVTVSEDLIPGIWLLYSDDIQKYFQIYLQKLNK